MSSSGSTSALRSFLMNLILKEFSLIDLVRSLFLDWFYEKSSSSCLVLSYGINSASRALALRPVVNGLNELYARFRLVS